MYILIVLFIVPFMFPSKRSTECHITVFSTPIIVLNATIVVAF